MQRLPRIIVSILLVGSLLPACDGSAPWSEDGDDSIPAARASLGPTAAYDRRMIFIGQGDRLPTAAVLDFEALSDSAGVRRGVRARVVDGQEWIDLLDEGWEMDPMREPSRLVPHGPLRMLVGDGGELLALEISDDARVRLEPGQVLAEQAPDAGTQLVLREATLLLDDERHPGVLLDAQLGRSVDPDFLPRAGTEASESGPGDETDDDGGRPTAASPTARPGTEGLLLDNAGFYAVIASAADGQVAWVRSTGQGEVRRGVQLRVTATETFQEAAEEVPTAWEISSASGDLTGELRVEAADRSILTGPGDVSTLGYVIVSGWIQDRSARRQVYGLVRHVR